MGPYLRTSRGKTGIMVVTDLFTRWVEAFAIPQATTGLLSILQTEIFSRYGYPRCLLTDNGCQFVSHQWRPKGKK
ncbi:MAG: integrase catalytic domain-containing protein [Arsenophonus sp. NC-TX2-MAG3]